MSLDAMKQALEALEAWNYLENPKPDANVIAALRAAIEQAQEPVAWISEGGDVSRSKRYMDEMGFKCNPLYTAPPPRQWQGLTDEERTQFKRLGFVGVEIIEAKLKERNT